MNFSIGNIFMALVMGAIGAWFVIKAFYINHQLLTIGWAEQKWGPGGGTTAYKLIGLFLLILSFFIFLGFVDIYGSAFGNSNKNNTKTNSSINQTPKNKPTPVQNGLIAP